MESTIPTVRSRLSLALALCFTLLPQSMRRYLLSVVVRQEVTLRLR